MTAAWSLEEMDCGEGKREADRNLNARENERN